jgi:hypothetical protein
MVKRWTEIAGWALLAAWLLAAYAMAQQVNPSQIKPGSNGQVLTTTGGVTGWGAAPLSLTLTTTGSSGAATLSGEVLNVPQYQGQLTLTTTGSSGAATLTGTTLNIPQYSGGGGSGLNGVNLQTSSYTAASGDNGKLVDFTLTAPATLTLPSPPSSTWAILTANSWSSTAVETIAWPSGTTLDGYASACTAQVNPGMGGWIFTDGTNFYTRTGAVITFSCVVPRIVQAYTLSTACGDPTCIISFPNPVTPGDAIIVEYMHSDGGTQEISDNVGDTFPSPNFTLLSGEFDLTQYVVCSAKGGATTVTNTGVYTIAAVYEIANIASSSCQDGYNGAGNDTSSQPASINTGSITRTDAYDFVLVSGGSRGSATQTITDSLGLTPLLTSGYIVSALNYQTFYGTPAATGSISDTVTATGANETNVAATILALKPAATSTALVNGDLISVGPSGALGPIHAGTAATVLTSNGPAAQPTYQALPAVGSTVEVGGTPCSTCNFNNTTPSAPSNGLNVNFQASGNNVSGAVVGDGNSAHYLSGTGTFTTPPGSGTTVIAAPPYVSIAGTFYDHDFYAVTKPPTFSSGCTFTSGFTWLNGVTPSSCATGTNGNQVIQTTSAINAWASESGSTSVEGVLNAASNLSGTGFVNAGIWIYDSTNGKIYTANAVTTGAVPAYEVSVQIWTCSSPCTSANPAFSSNAITAFPGAYGFGNNLHAKLSVSGTTLTAAISLDGGVTFTPLITETVGTITKGGYEIQGAASTTLSENIESILVQ